MLWTSAKVLAVLYPRGWADMSPFNQQDVSCWLKRSFTPVFQRTSPPGHRDAAAHLFNRRSALNDPSLQKSQQIDEVGISSSAFSGS
jgi:hypothetical protein